MKNHWVQEHKRKNLKWWTAEFYRNGIYLLKARRTRVVNLRSVPNLATLVFALGDPFADIELVAFIKEARQDMSDMIARLRYFTGIFPKAQQNETYELTNLTFNTTSGGLVSMDITLDFGFRYLKKY